MWSKALEIALKKVVRRGTLTVALPGGDRLVFGNGEEPSAAVNISNSAILRRLVMNPELALGESYMNGGLKIEGDDLHGLLEVILRNLNDPERIWWQDLRLSSRALMRRFLQNNVSGLSRRNVAHHYDLSGELYELFLDADRQYSCAYFRSSEDSLEQAQDQKKHHIARKLNLRPGLKVLDIGCGWGGMALTLARNYGVRVLGITLSEEQLAVARERAAAENLEDRVEFRLTDYRDLTGSFDRIVSVGMFEHVGLRHFDPYFKAVRDLLAPDGVALIHSIGLSERPDATNAWIAKYIFPGGYIPSLSEMAAAVERQNLWISDVETLRLHYAETLRHWFDRFVENEERVREIYDERFVRMWKFYLVACEQTFRFRRQCVFQFQITKDIEALPITRDYLYPPEAETRLRAAE